MEKITSGRTQNILKLSGTSPLLFFAAALVVLITLTAGGTALAWDGQGPLVADHTCSDLSDVPVEWVETVKSSAVMYYGHLSHGEQITGGLTQINNNDPFYAFAFEYRKLPTATHVFAINDNHAVTPEYYWKGEYGIPYTRDALNVSPGTNLSMFMWCDHLTYYTAEEVDDYLASMEALEAEFPRITFIYATGHAQNGGAPGYNRYLRNEQIRAYCAANDKILYDFADMDVWWFNPATSEWEQNSYQYDGHTVPIEHPRYDLEEWGHTSFEMCTLKGNMMWWLVSVLSGWNPSPLTGVEDMPAAGALEQNFPNPFNPVTRIAFTLENAGHSRLDIFDPAGRLVKTLVDEDLPAARHEVNWDGRDGSGRQASSGVYFYSIITDDFRDTKKMILLR